MWYLAAGIALANVVFLLLLKWRGYMTLDRYWLSLMLVATPFAWALGYMFLADFLHSIPRSGDELVHGRVFMRQKMRDPWGLEHPELTIQIDGKQDMVKANLIGTDMKKIPDEVSFYYSGDPSREVYLREESNPIWGALFLLLGPLFLIVVLLSVERARRPAVST